jgi:hypothetical protein
MNIFSRRKPGPAMQETIADNHPAIVLVSGLPRSGTSMMMKMLEAGGLPALTDNLRTADISNPKGYYEFERVKKLKEADVAWLEDARGRSVKVISALLEHLPPSYNYKVIFMLRNIAEVLASQKKMLISRGEPTDKVSDEQMADLYKKHLAHIKAWLSRQPNFTVYYADYNQIVANPLDHLQNIAAFLNQQVEIQPMLKVIDPDLYRQRYGS